MERWPNQVRAFEGAVEAIGRGVKRLCITSPTGSGKSVSMMDMIRWAVANNKPVVLYSNRRMLFDQTSRVLEREGIDYGKRASGHETATLRDVQLAMWQTEASKVYRTEDRDLHPAKLVLIDECHQGRGDVFRKIMGDHVAAGASIVGYTATPLDLVDYDELLVAGTPSECRSFGALVPAETYAPDEPDLKHIKKYQVGEDLSERENAKAIMRPGVFSRVVQAWRQHNPDQRPTLLFGPDVKGSLWFAQQFAAAGIRAAHIDGDECWVDGDFHGTDQETRDYIAELSRTGQVKVVCNRFVLREGIDWPWIECGIFATVFGALTSYIQSGGRLLRACPSTGKKDALILDHGGNYHRHGSLNEDRDWFLGLTNHRAVGERQERIRERKVSEPIVCPECGKVRAGGKKCFACGYEAHRKSRMVVQIDGTLKPVTGDVYRPRQQRKTPTTEATWRQMYYRAKSAKWDATFRQAEAMFFHENHYWPPRNLPFMPKEAGDWWRKVADVPASNLVA